MSGWRQRGYAPQYKPEELKVAMPLDITSDIWNNFNELSKRRNWGENGPRYITFPEIKAFIEVTGVELKSWEIDTILQLDDAFIQVWIENKSKDA